MTLAEATERMAYTAKVGNEPIRATIHDPDGPRPVRFAVPAVAVLLFGIALLPHVMKATGGGVMIAAMLVGLLARVLTPRRSPRQAVVVAETKGRVRVRKAGLLTQTIRATDILGATTFPLAGRFALAMTLKTRPRSPVVIEVDRESERAAICSALGIGPAGHGTVDWDVRPPVLARIDTYVRPALALMWVVWAFIPHRWMSWIQNDLTWPTLGAFVLYLAGRFSQRETLSLSRNGLSVRTPHIRSTTGFDEVTDLEVRGDTIVIAGADPLVLPAPRARWTLGGLSSVDREQLIAAVRSAIDRAKNARAAEVLPSVEVIRPRDEAPLAWLARLDALGVSVVETAYRAGALHVRELWKTLEDPDEDVAVRAAAARLLTRTVPEEARVRVAPILETVREVHARKRIEAMIEPDAVRALELLGRPTKRWQPHPPVRASRYRVTADVASGAQIGSRFRHDRKTGARRMDSDSSANHGLRSLKAEVADRPRRSLHGLAGAGWARVRSVAPSDARSLARILARQASQAIPTTERSIRGRAARVPEAVARDLIRIEVLDSLAPALLS